MSLWPSSISLSPSLIQSLPCCANLAVKHYMLKPIQRIPQYQLLLTSEDRVYALFKYIAVAKLFLVVF